MVPNSWHGLKGGSTGRRAKRGARTEECWQQARQSFLEERVGSDGVGCTCSPNGNKRLFYVTLSLWELEKIHSASALEVKHSIPIKICFIFNVQVSNGQTVSRTCTDLALFLLLFIVYPKLTTVVTVSFVVIKLFFNKTRFFFFSAAALYEQNWTFFTSAPQKELTAMLPSISLSCVSEKNVKRPQSTKL